MQPGGAQPVSQADAVDIPGRPDYVDSYVQGNRPIPATAVNAVTPEHERSTTRRETAVVYMPAAPREMMYFSQCIAHAYITPADAPCKAHPAPFIRAAIGAVLPALWYELHPPGHGADRKVRFRCPEDREAAMARQPFALDGATVKLVREGESSNVRRIRLETLAHVALHGYPREQRSVEEIRGNCNSFGHLIEVDPACFAAPDLSPVRAVIRLQHAREIPREVRIRWGGWWLHVVPVQILRVWDWSESLDANGEYVPIYGPAAVVPP
ncbi:hypothetical protein SEVIR_9G139175v4 [Setaria viridis]|uniref:DUF4283 domain-containing protein n=1 Tax=Setaria viridis TaxID=4556 RepID=A0A4U6STU4_SETVI|nr:hypothetical protein SEVIR_9G139175v2 [Setaria viridis]